MLIVSICQPVWSDGLSNEEQRKIAADQCNIGQDSTYREQLVPILLNDANDQKSSARKYLIGGPLMLCAGIVGLFGGYKYASRHGNDYLLSNFLCGVLSGAITVVGGTITAQAIQALSFWNKWIKHRLEKAEKDQEDWYRIEQLARYRILQNTNWMCTSAQKKDQFFYKEPAELYNSSTKQTVPWDVNNQKFLKKTLAGEYNSSAWQFRKVRPDRTPEDI